MKSYAEFTREELENEREALSKSLSDLKALNLFLNMTRGNPSPEQLKISSGLFDNISDDGFISENGEDCRNYGVPSGIAEARRLMADVLDTTEDKVVLGNSSSLNMMFDSFSRAMLFGEHDSDKPWSQIDGRKWLCPAPGYDRHFKVAQKFGFELVAVPMKNDGPDMDAVEKLVSEDDKVLGIWCVPVYSNPGGVVYSEETCKRLAGMKTAAKDFRIYWDNAYVVHHLTDEHFAVPDMLSLCETAGNASRVYEFASTSKITFAGSGLCCMAANSENLDYAKGIMGIQTICSNKVSQLAHARFLKNKNGVLDVMKKHAEIIKPKFDMVGKVLSDDLSGLGIAYWTEPKGGYFVSVDVFPGTADKVVSLCSECGVKLTPAGATFPYGKDPENKNIRLAPTFPSVEEIEKAMAVFTACVRLAAIDKMINA